MPRARSPENFYPCRCRRRMHSCRMGKHGSLTYLRPNNKIVLAGENLQLRLMVINSEVARLRFTDEEGAHVDFPSNFVVKKHRPGVEEPAEPVLDNDMFLTRYHSYCIFRDGEAFLRLEQQGQQSLQGSADLVVITA